jgi:hypothetical protein
MDTRSTFAFLQEHRKVPLLAPSGDARTGAVAPHDTISEAAELADEAELTHLHRRHQVMETALGGSRTARVDASKPSKVVHGPFRRYNDAKPEEPVPSSGGATVLPPLPVSSAPHGRAGEHVMTSRTPLKRESTDERVVWGGEGSIPIGVHKLLPLDVHGTTTVEMTPAGVIVEPLPEGDGRPRLPPVEAPPASEAPAEEALPRKVLQPIVSTPPVSILGTPGGGSEYRGVPAATPAQVIRLRRNLISDYELGEILEFKAVFFVGGPRVAKTKASSRLPHNHGFDDERGEYQWVEGDHILYRYEILSRLGAGSFGQVLRCLDHKTGEEVAIKIVRNRKRFHKQAKVEVALLERIKAADRDASACVIHLEQSFIFRSHLCIVFPILAMNLYELSESCALVGCRGVAIVGRSQTAQLSGFQPPHNSQIRPPAPALPGLAGARKDCPLRPQA